MSFGVYNIRHVDRLFLQLETYVNMNLSTLSICAATCNCESLICGAAFLCRYRS